MVTALGVSSGQAVWAAATSLGVAALIVASEPVFVALKLVGAAYLVYLGAQALLRAVWGSGARGAAPGDRGAQGLASSRAFRQGLFSNFSDPKMAVFFTSRLPQFAASGDGAFLALLALGLGFCSLTFVWLTGYALIVARAGDVLRRPTVRRVLDALMGVVLVAMGFRLALDRR